MAQEMSGLFCTDSFTTDFIFIPFTTFIAPWLWESLRDTIPVSPGIVFGLPE